jgi:carboxypeptidase Q
MKHFRKHLSVLAIFLVLSLSSCTFLEDISESFLQLPPDPSKPTDDYSKVTKAVMDALLHDPEYKHHAYNEVAYVVDTFGPRLLGSQALEDALQHLYQLLTDEGFQNVKLEKVPLTRKWIRGQESLTLFSPRATPTKVPLIGLGKSVGGDVTAEVVMLTSFDELDVKGKAGLLKGKIAFFNPEWVSYGANAGYRVIGPSMAAKYGAIGCLVRSVAPVSIENPHTGALIYDESLPKIPAAAISLEDADMFSRMVTRGQKVVVNLYMEAKWVEGDFVTHNLIGEITGSTYPEQILLMGGHVDSWDTGPQTGANDDAAGFMVCFEAIRVLIKKGFRPKRTIRFIAWVGEEFAEEVGSFSYIETHKAEMDNHIIAFESDMGTTDLYGFGYTGGRKGYTVVRDTADMYLKAFNASTVIFDDGEQADTEPLNTKFGIPMVTNLIKDTPDQSYYFTYHHSAGDSVSILRPDDMDRNVVGIASLFYVLADYPDRLPKD